MAHERIVIIEDDTDIQDLLRERLRDEQFSVISAFSGEEGFSVCREKKPDLVLLDIMLPGQSGFDVLRSLKSSGETKHIPVIMLTARSDEADVVSALEIGADDYVTKPFNFKILAARMRRLLRKVKPGDGFSSGASAEEEKLLLRYGNLEVDKSRYLVRAGEQRFDLSATEFAILCLLVENPGRVFTRSQIIAHVRGENYAVTDRTIDVHITSLRKILGEFFPIETIRGIGYRLRENI